VTTARAVSWCARAVSLGTALAVWARFGWARSTGAVPWAAIWIPATVTAVAAGSWWANSRRPRRPP